MTENQNYRKNMELKPPRHFMGQTPQVTLCVNQGPARKCNLAKLEGSDKICKCQANAEGYPPRKTQG